TRAGKSAAQQTGEAIQAFGERQQTAGRAAAERHAAELALKFPKAKRNTPKAPTNASPRETVTAQASGAEPAPRVTTTERAPMSMAAERIAGTDVTPKPLPRGVLSAENRDKGMRSGSVRYVSPARKMASDTVTSDPDERRRRMMGGV